MQKNEILKEIGKRGGGTLVFLAVQYLKVLNSEQNLQRSLESFYGHMDIPLQRICQTKYFNCQKAAEANGKS